jgi:hypothetical protein
MLCFFRHGDDLDSGEKEAAETELSRNLNLDSITPMLSPRLLRGAFAEARYRGRVTVHFDRAIGLPKSGVDAVRKAYTDAGCQAFIAPCSGHGHRCQTRSGSLALRLLPTAALLEVRDILQPTIFGEVLSEELGG